MYNALRGVANDSVAAEWLERYDRYRKEWLPTMDYSNPDIEHASQFLAASSIDEVIRRNSEWHDYIGHNYIGDHKIQ